VTTAKAKAEAEAKAASEKAAAEAKVVILASARHRLFVCSKSTVCFGEMETPLFWGLQTKEASVHPELYLRAPVSQRLTDPRTPSLESTQKWRSSRANLHLTESDIRYTMVDERPADPTS